MTENEIAKVVFESALEVHKKLGPGLFENAYHECLYYELHKRELNVKKDKSQPLVYEGVKLAVGYKIALIIEDKFVVVVKSVDTLNDVHMAQIRTYLKLSNCTLGMLINFNVSLIKHGVKRVFNTQKAKPEEVEP